MEESKKLSTDSAQQEAKPGQEKKKKPGKKPFRGLRISLDGPYSKTKYKLYRPNKKEAYRPLECDRIKPNQVDFKEKWTLNEISERSTKDDDVMGQICSFFDFQRRESPVKRRWPNCC